MDHSQLSAEIRRLEREVSATVRERDEARGWHNELKISCAALRAEVEVLRQGRLSDPLLKATVGPLMDENSALRTRIAVLEKVVEWAKDYVQLCTCPQSNLTGGDPNCPIHGQPPSSVTYTYCESCAALRESMKLDVATMDAKDARIRELEEMNAALNRSYLLDRIVFLENDKIRLRGVLSQITESFAGEQIRTMCKNVLEEIKP